MNAAFDFRAHQARARRASFFFVVAFLTMAAAISLAVGVLAGVLLGAERPPGPGQATLGAVDPEMAALAAGLVMAVIVGVAGVRLLLFGGDGASVAKSLGAVEVTEDTQNPYKRRYLNVVEEMAIAAGLPRPRAFVMKHEQGINAFAAGNDPTRAAIGVTHGALAKLTRAELAGVVAHEMAHIRNRDTRLNVRLLAMVFGLVALYVVGRGMLRAMVFRRRGSDNRGAAPFLVIGVALFALGLLGTLFGRILQSAVSRRREFLADATAVELTRNPAGIAGALKKIRGTLDGGQVRNAHAEEARHMFFAQATGSFAGLFATHPPLEARIRALEPDYRPEAVARTRDDERAMLREARAELGPWGALAGKERR